MTLSVCSGGKLTINAAINPLGALLRVPNGALLQSEHLSPDNGGSDRRVTHCGTFERHCASEGKYNRFGSAGCRDTSVNLNSMLQDVLHHRRTEIEAINGALAREGKEHNLQTPINDLLTTLMLGLEQTYPVQVKTAPCSLSGELINSTRKQVAEAVAARDAAYIVELACRQKEAGANFIDVNAGARPQQESR